MFLKLDSYTVYRKRKQS